MYEIERDEQVFGPYIASQVIEWIGDGRLVASDLIWSRECAEKQLLGDSSEFGGCFVEPTTAEAGSGQLASGLLIPAAGTPAAAGDAASEARLMWMAERKKKKKYWLYFSLVYWLLILGVGYFSSNIIVPFVGFVVWKVLGMLVFASFGGSGGSNSGGDCSGGGDSSCGGGGCGGGGD